MNAPVATTPLPQTLPTIDYLREVVASWKSDARMSECPKLKMRMRNHFRGQSLGLTEIYCELLHDILSISEYHSEEARRLDTHETFYAIVFEEIEKALREGHAYFAETVRTAEGQTDIQVRACELWNSFTHAVNVFTQFIGIPEGEYARTLIRDGAIHHIVLSRELAGVVTFSDRLELEDPNAFLRTYTPLKADVRDRNIAQVLRMDEMSYKVKVDWILRHLKTSLKNSRSLD